MGGNPGCGAICRGRVRWVDEAPRHTWGGFPTAPPPPEDILMGEGAEEEPGEGARHDSRRVSHGCNSWGAG